MSVDCMLLGKVCVFSDRLHEFHGLELHTPATAVHRSMLQESMIIASGSGAI